MADLAENAVVKFEDVLAAAMRVPIVKVHREAFLRKELQKYCSEAVIGEAIKGNPAKAGIKKSLVDKIAKSVIDYETNKVTAFSAAASLPGGAAAVGAAAADITSYFAFLLRVVQELAYLYGFDEFELNENNMDSETMNLLLLFMGVMFGVQGASAALKKASEVLARQAAKSIAKQALTKGAIYPIVKSVAKKVGIRMTKQIFADTAASAIPVVGALASGGLTYAMFKPCCIKLQEELRQYNLCDPAFYKQAALE